MQRRWVGLVLVLFLLLAWVPAAAQTVAPPASGTPAPLTAPPATLTATIVPMASPASMQVPPAAGLPPNPAQLDRAQIYASLVKGAAAAVLVFVIIGLYGALRRLAPKGW